MNRLSPLLLALSVGCGDPVVVKDYLTVVGVAPSHGSMDVAPDTDVRVTFNANLDEASLAAAVLLTDGDDLPVASDLYWDAGTLTLVVTPLEPMVVDVTHTLSLGTTLESDFGALPGGFSSSFTTGLPAPDTGNLPPVADVQLPAPCTVGQVTPLDGTGSYDPEGGVITFAWRVIEAPDEAPPPLSDPEQPVASLVASTAGRHAVGLVVDDGEAASSEAIVSFDCE